MRLGPRLALGSGPSRVNPHVVRVPSGFPWPPSFSIIQTGPRSFTTTLDPTSLAPSTSATLYANTARPNNTGNAQSWAAADQAIWAALNHVGVGTATRLYIMGSADPDAPTIYPWTKAWRVGTSGNLHVTVVSDENGTPGYAVSSTALVAGDGELGAWGLVGGSEPNTYSATLTTAPAKVIDGNVLDSDGVATTLTLRASAAAVEANPGSYYHAAGVLYVRTADSRAPSFPTLRPLRGGTSVNGLANGARTVHVERLSFEGGSTRIFYAQEANVSFVDCDFTHGTALGFEMSIPGTTTDATRTAHLIRCRFLRNAGDGCGYTAAGSGMTIRGFEWGCTYANNSGAGTDQGGSAHFTSGNTEISVIRLTPTCRGNKTHGFADVGGCDTWILGGTVSGESAGVHIGDGGTGWLQDVVFSSNTEDLQTDDAAGRIYVSGVHYDPAKVDGAGTVQVYVP
jgi:hypothetical protein